MSWRSSAGWAWPHDNVPTRFAWGWRSLFSPFLGLVEKVLSILWVVVEWVHGEPLDSWPKSQFVLTSKVLDCRIVHICNICAQELEIPIIHMGSRRDLIAWRVLSDGGLPSADSLCFLFSR